MDECKEGRMVEEREGKKEGRRKMDYGWMKKNGKKEGMNEKRKEEEKGRRMDGRK